jgi:hypothetical protein
LKKKVRRVYFDCNIFDEFSQGEVRTALLRRANREAGVVICFSPVNLDEIFAGMVEPSERQRLEFLLSSLEDLLYPRILQEHSDIMDNVGNLVVSQEERSIPIFMPTNAPRESPGKVFAALKRMEQSQVREVAEQIRQTNRAGNNVLKGFQEAVRESVCKRKELHPDMSFAEFVKLAKKDRLIGFSVSRPLRGNHSALRRAAKQRTEPLHSISNLILYRVWVEITRKGKPRGSTKFGFRDMQQVTYLPFVKKFVTNDRRFRKAIKSSSPHLAKKVVTLGEFESWLELAVNN